MINSLNLFFYYLNESIKEIKNNFKIYLIYIFSLCLASVVQNGLDLIFSKNELILRIISKVLFSIVPILILSKILYVIKIRNFGVGEYRKIVLRFLLYNFYYFVLVLLAAALYFIPAMIASTIITMRSGFLMTLFLLVPLVYIMIFYSMSPFIAVFDDENILNVFSQSKKLTSKNIFLVIINHLCSLLIPGFFSLIILINNSLLKFSLALIVSVPEAIFSILMILTTTKIYLYLIEKE
ncbi:MAG: hypothetical protein H7281_16190 [Bacteriovorax sp.]|nr:hypothetical protein [Bacteriovorax sp.]